MVFHRRIFEIAAKSDASFPDDTSQRRRPMTRHIGGIGAPSTF
jgi:hypothetical protein